MPSCRAPNGKQWVCEYGHPLRIEGCSEPELASERRMDTRGRWFYPAV